MSKYIKIDTLYISIDSMKKRYMKDETRLLDYKRIGIEYNGEDRRNLSQLMYSKIKKKNARFTGEVIKVDPESYNYSRHMIIDAIMILVIEDAQRGLTSQSIRSSVIGYISFVDWLNSEGIALPVNLKAAREAYLLYVLYLRERLRKGTLSHGTAHIKQRYAVKVLEEMFDDPENTITAFIKTIPQQISKKNTGRAVTEEDVEYAFNFYYSFFDQVADFLLESKPYPHKLILLGGNAVILPKVYTQIFPLNNNWNQLGKFIDLNSGTILNEKETIAQVTDSDDWHKISKNNQYSRVWVTLKSRKKIIADIDLSNHNIQSDTLRLRLGQRAMKAYYMVLLALTGMNDVGLAMMPWDDEGFDEEKETQGFRTIKPRAKNKKVLFEIQKEFMPSFKKYLQFRKFMLNGYQSNYLFFTGYGKEIKISKAQRDGVFSSNIYGNSFKKFNPNLPSVVSRDFRLYKTKWVRRESGLFVAASMAQHSIQTSEKHYDGETEEEQTGQVGNFLEAVHNRIATYKRKEIETNVVAGTCDDYGIPEAIQKDVSIVPDCHQPEGCFFCTKHRLHPDEEDIRKLLSLEYIIREVSISNARSIEQFNKIMGPVLEKIDEYLIELKDYQEGVENMINDIRTDVFENENLTPYWEYKLAMMYRMGVVK